MDSELKARIDTQIKGSPVLLYMKGNKMFPMCGFSKAVCDILNHLDVPFETVDILEDENLRAGIKEYSQWPTIPQLYVKGEFVGGCDIIVEQYKKGELEPMLKKALED